MTTTTAVLATILEEAQAHHRVGQLDLAEQRCRQVLAKAPKHPMALALLGAIAGARGEPERAAHYLTRAAAVDPSNPNIHYNLGVALRATGRLAESAKSFRTTIALMPVHAFALNNLGNVLKELGEREEAIRCYERALAVRPDLASARFNAAVLLEELGKLEEAAAVYRQLTIEAPDFPRALGSWIFARRCLCDWEGIREDEDRLIALARDGHDVTSPFAYLSFPSSPADQLANARAFATKKMVSRGLPRRRPGRHGKVRIGYLSADFRNHATAHLIAEMIECHDRARFSISAYSTGPDDGSDMRRRMVAAFDRFIDIRTAADEDAAARIHKDEIDILIDLNGYTRGERSRILAFRPAPIQVNFLGYPGTMGADFIDYIIADDFIIPAGEEQYYSERVIRLPRCYQPNDSLREIVEPPPSRKELNLPEDGFVFCCLNSPYKFTPALFDIWARLLNAVPNSVLWVLEGHPRVKVNLQAEASRRGVAPERIVFAARKPPAEYLASLTAADLFLDTVPVNAHTTASDALWAGLPVLTCAGATFAARVAGSLLLAVGLDELITTSLADYERLAFQLATDPVRLAELRHRLQQQRANATLFDGRHFARDLEAAFEFMLKQA